MSTPIVDHYEVNVTYYAGLNGIREMWHHYACIVLPSDLTKEQAHTRAVQLLQGLNHGCGTSTPAFAGFLRVVHAQTSTIEEL